MALRTNLVHEILNLAKAVTIDVTASDPLCKWIKEPSVSHIRAVQRAIHLSTARDMKCLNDPHFLLALTSLPTIACFLYSTLFVAVRNLLRRFRASNPTWHKGPTSHRDKIAVDWDSFALCFLQGFQYLNERLRLQKNCSIATLQTASVTSLPFSSHTFDGVLTSPPYATRIDYAINSLPELAILGLDDNLLTSLRSATIGSPVLSRKTASLESGGLISQNGIAIIDAIRNHSSKGSRSYYMPWMHGYLSALQQGLSEIHRTVAPHGTICMVLQDSYYKSLHIDLQRIVTEMLSALGRSLVARHDFPVATLRSRMNPRARRHLDARNNSESLLVFN